ncbi:MAG: S-adenosylmethionine:tRNA ribosyltransferase-isomerase [Candidatus Eremiobacteraeota bacterium]|nr:S-adenosylmethionine:tRNA ribosyltransferase-isomerase [Candidatus Eremiobacteraeota bacterium]
MTVAPAFARGLIEATEPPEYRGVPRDGVRMLVTDRRSRSHSHMHFDDLPQVLQPGDLLVVNDSATLPAAIVARRHDATTVALHVSTKIDERLWIVEPRDPVVAGETLALRNRGTAVMIAPVDSHRARLWYVAFELRVPMYAYLADYGKPIAYGYVAARFPLSAYQTLFAREIGSSEMPSAARPFTKGVVTLLKRRGVEIATVTLHCGVASFEAPELPGTERFIVGRAAAEAVNAARREARRVVAVGTTVVRALESAATNDGVVPAAGWTDLFIDDRHELKAVDALLSGFHDSSSTHLSMLRAFADSELLDDAYANAADRGYYRHEFGDVHLIA